MKYRMTVYYRTPNTELVTEHVQKMIPEWRKTERELIASRVWEWKTDTPLTDKKIKAIKALKEDWMDEIVIEEVNE